MKAVILKQFGAPENLTVAEMPVPQVSDGNILVEVKATSVNPVDCRIRRGEAPGFAPPLPAVLHGDVAGIVADPGKSTKFKRGDKIYALSGGCINMAGGALAEFMLVEEKMAAHMPSNLTFEEAASLPLVFITAWLAMVERGNIKQNEKILVHAATGGVGHIAIQLGKWLGAEVYSTASSEEKRTLGIELGANGVFNYKNEAVKDYAGKATGGKGFDAVFDTVGGLNLEKSFEAAAEYGRVLAISTWGQRDLSLMNVKSLTLHVIVCFMTLKNGKGKERYGKILEKLTEIVEKGYIKPLLDKRTFSIFEAAEAHKLMESNGHTGKIVLSIKK